MPYEKPETYYDGRGFRNAKNKSVKAKYNSYENKGDRAPGTGKHGKGRMTRGSHRIEIQFILKKGQ